MLAATLFFEKNMDKAVNKYENVLKISDKEAALDFAKAIKKSDKLKGNMYLQSTNGSYWIRTTIYNCR